MRQRGHHIDGVLARHAGQREIYLLKLGDIVQKSEVADRMAPISKLHQVRHHPRKIREPIPTQVKRAEAAEIWWQCQIAKSHVKKLELHQASQARRQRQVCDEILREVERLETG